MAHILILFVINSLTVFALFILLARSLWTLGSNVTTIESWEIERHKTLLRRARYFGGYLEGPGGIKIRIKKQEFPYDIGILANIKAGMGGSINILSWFWPLAQTPSPQSGLDFEVNGFEESNVSWPPPDPDRIPLPAKSFRNDDAFTDPQTYSSAYEQVEAFNRRKAEDLKRQKAGMEVQRRKRFGKRLKEENNRDSDSEGTDPRSDNESDDGEEGWKNSEGERLRDFGVDEDIEFYDEEDIPLGILMQQRSKRQ
ncbi:Palmitoyltransferase [Aspergillus wentii]